MLIFSKKFANTPRSYHNALNKLRLWITSLFPDFIKIFIIATISYLVGDSLPVENLTLTYNLRDRRGISLLISKELTHFVSLISFDTP